jgi:predicted dithiol-disulfide oxidoreductase (DUF899 family)
MVYYGILDRVPGERDEGAPAYQSWIRRHDEYEQPPTPAASA